MCWSVGLAEIRGQTPQSGFQNCVLNRSITREVGAEDLAVAQSTGGSPPETRQRTVEVGYPCSPEIRMAHHVPTKRDLMASCPKGPGPKNLFTLLLSALGSRNPGRYPPRTVDLRAARVFVP